MASSTPMARKIPLIQENQNMPPERINRRELLEETSRLEQHVSQMSDHSHLNRELEIFSCPKVEERSSLWDSLGHSPLVFEADACNKIMKLYFDVSKYDPSEIQVVVQDNVLIIQAIHEDVTCKSKQNDDYRELNIKFPLPSFVETKTLKAKICGDGLLVVEAKLTKPSLTGNESDTSQSEVERGVPPKKK